LRLVVFPKLPLCTTSGIISPATKGLDNLIKIVPKGLDKFYSNAYNISKMFIRAKKFNGRTYYYLVEAYREHGKPKQRVIRYLGKDKPSPEALQRIISEVKK